MPTYGLYLSTLVYEFIGIYVRKLSYLKEINEKESIKILEINFFNIVEFIEKRI